MDGNRVAVQPTACRLIKRSGPFDMRKANEDYLSDTMLPGGSYQVPKINSVSNLEKPLRVRLEQDACEVNDLIDALNRLVQRIRVG